jgi:hypothetical protein
MLARHSDINKGQADRKRGGVGGRVGWGGRRGCRAGAGSRWRGDSLARGLGLARGLELARGLGCALGVSGRRSASSGWRSASRVGARRLGLALGVLGLGLASSGWAWRLRAGARRAVPLDGDRYGSSGAQGSSSSAPSTAARAWCAPGARGATALRATLKTPFARHPAPHLGTRGSRLESRSRTRTWPLMPLDRIDEYRRRMHPVLLGTDIALFDAAAPERPPTLLRATP